MAHAQPDAGQPVTSPPDEPLQFDGVAPVASPVPVEEPPPPPLLRPLTEAIHVAPGVTCIKADVLVRRVARWLRRDAIEPGLRIDVRGSSVRRNAAAFAIVRSNGRRAERRIDDGPIECDQLQTALALSIALAIDAALSEEDGAAPPLPSDEDLFAVSEPPEPPYFKLALGVLGHATAGVLTSVSGALSARVEVGFVRWLDLRAGVWATTLDDQTFATAPGRFSMTLVAGELEGCLAHAVASRLRLAACAGFAVGVLNTRGHEDSELKALSDEKPWVAGEGGIEAQAELLPWFSIVVDVDLVVPLARQRIVVTSADTGAPVGRRELTAVGVLVGAGPVFRVF